MQQELFKAAAPMATRTQPMNVLIGCERSGVIREAFRKAGHNAWSCDLAPAEDGSAWHIKGDVLEALRRGCPDRVGGWHLFGVHPSCRFLNSAGMHWTVRGHRDPKETEKAIAFAEACWTEGKQHAQSMFLENPVGVLSTRSILGKPKPPRGQIIQPFHFGEDASKGTCLWLHHLPLLVPTKFIAPRMVCRQCKGRYAWQGEVKGCCPLCGAEAAKYCLPRWGNQTDGGQNKLAPSEDRWMERSRTYPGIAAAMAQQWSATIK